MKICYEYQVPSTVTVKEEKDEEEESDDEKEEEEEIEEREGVVGISITGREDAYSILWVLNPGPWVLVPLSGTPKERYRS